MPAGTASESIFGAISVTLMYGNMWIILAEAITFSGLFGHCFFFSWEKMQGMFSQSVNREPPWLLSTCLLHASWGAWYSVTEGGESQRRLRQGVSACLGRGCILK